MWESASGDTEDGGTRNDWKLYKGIPVIQLSIISCAEVEMSPPTLLCQIQALPVGQN